jgi:hypothetical protein
MKKIRYNFHICLDLLEALKNQAVKERTTVSDLIRQTLWDKIDKLNNNKKGE